MNLIIKGFLYFIHKSFFLLAALGLGIAFRRGSQRIAGQLVKSSKRFFRLLA